MLNYDTEESLFRKGHLILFNKCRIIVGYATDILHGAEHVVWNENVVNLFERKSLSEGFGIKLNARFGSLKYKV